MYSTTISVFSGVITILLATIGYLVRRSIFGELDALKKELGEKVDAQIFHQSQETITETLKDIKETLRKNGDTLQDMKVDVAVVKARIEKS
jgi:hypothetical protein